VDECKLLDSGAVIDLPDAIRANCALHLAAREGHRDTVRLLAGAYTHSLLY